MITQTPSTKRYRRPQVVMALIILLLTLATACATQPSSTYSPTMELAVESEAPAADAPAETAPTIVIKKEAEAGEAAAVESVEVEKKVESPSESLRPARVEQIDPLKAGEVDDNQKWDDYLTYRRGYQGPLVHDRDVSERYTIQALDADGHPIMDANVRFFLGNQEIYQAYTYANGQALFHPLALGLTTEYGDEFLVVVKKGNAVTKFTMPRLHSQQTFGGSETWTATLDLTQRADSVNLDLLFLIDATGSMDDEINAIQTTIFDVAARIDNLPERPDVRYGMVTYRDRGDQFISRNYDFVNNVDAFSRNLSSVQAQGGGDYPESLNEGLHNALHDVEWRSDDAVRLIFLVADAPPHLDYRQDFDYALEMETAARSAIKIFPIASSGLDDQGEYIFRQLAQFTQGRFIFLTYDGPTNSGKSGDVTTHHVDSYSVDTLDDLLVKLVTEELAHQNPLLAQYQQ